MPHEIGANGKEVTLIIDGMKAQAKEGTFILEVARQIGIQIPTLCYNAALSPFGACRICCVEITDARGRNRIVTSCNYPAEEGLIVETKSERVLNIRRKLLEFLLARAPKVARIRNLARIYGVENANLWVENEDEDCILCGLCVRVCNELIGVSAINFAKRGVKREITTPYNEFSDDCMGCGACAMICPTGSKRVRTHTYSTLKPLTGPKDENLGVCLDIFSAKSSIEGQDGGVATAILISGLKNGLFDTAIVVQRTEGYRPEAVAAENVDEIMKARGTKYLRVKMVPKIKELINAGKTKIAVVGPPCQARAARKIEQALKEGFSNLEIAIIGLFCFESFDYNKLKADTGRLMGVDLDKADKTQIRKGKFSLKIDGNEYSCKVKDLKNAIEKGCLYCSDFPALYADVSVGAVGSAEGFSTVIVRTERGKRLLEGVSLTKGDFNKDEIARLCTLKRDRAKTNFAPLVDGIHAARLQEKAV